MLSFVAVNALGDVFPAPRSMDARLREEQASSDLSSGEQV
jgi:hypothetical protein